MDIIWCARNLKDLMGKSRGHRAHSLLYIGIIRAMDTLLHQADLFRAHFIQWLFLVHTSFIFLQPLPTAFCLLDQQKMIAAQPTTRRRWLTTRWYYSKCCSAAQLSSNLSTEVVTTLVERRCSSMIHDRAEHEIFEKSACRLRVQLYSRRNWY